MWELDCKENWAQKNCCFWIVMLEKTLESPLEIRLAHPKGNQSWVSVGRTNVETETPIFLATWWEELTHLRRPWCWERLRAGGEGDARGWDGWDGIKESMDMGLGRLWQLVMDEEAWHAALHGVTKSWSQLSDWTTTITSIKGVVWEFQNVLLL